MSPPNSDSLFDSADFEPAEGFDAEGGAADPASMLGGDQLARPVAPVQPQPFSIYTAMLIMSLVALTTAAIVFFMESSSY